jgi:hypothetical protein
MAKRCSLSAIDLTAVSDDQHKHQDGSIVDRVDNAVVTDAHAILIVSSSQLLAAARARVLGQ